jgi:hypothetical protein
MHLDDSLLLHLCLLYKVLTSIHSHTDTQTDNRMVVLVQLIMLWCPAHRSCCSRCSQPGVVNSISMAGRLLMFTLSTRVCSKSRKQLAAAADREAR